MQQLLKFEYLVGIANFLTLGHDPVVYKVLFVQTNYQKIKSNQITKPQNILSEFIVLCWVTFAGILGACGLEATG